LIKRGYDVTHFKYNNIQVKRINENVYKNLEYLLSLGPVEENKLTQLLVYMLDMVGKYKDETIKLLVSYGANAIS
jgi:hypothetical protein